MFTGAQEIVVTRDMHERKRMMFERADAFVALPGGIWGCQATGRAADLVAAWPSPQTHSGRQHQRLLGAAGRVARTYEAIGFIHSDLMFDYAVVDRIEDVVPAIKSAAARTSPPGRTGARSDAADVGSVRLTARACGLRYLRSAEREIEHGEIFRQPLGTRRLAG